MQRLGSAHPPQPALEDKSGLSWCPRVWWALTPLQHSMSFRNQKSVVYLSNQSVFLPSCICAALSVPTHLFFGLSAVFSVCLSAAYPSCIHQHKCLHICLHVCVHASPLFLLIHHLLTIPRISSSLRGLGKRDRASLTLTRECLAPKAGTQ